MSETAVQTPDQTVIAEAVAGADGQTAPPKGESAGEGPVTPTDPNPSLVESRDRYRGERDAAREELATAQGRIEGYQRAEIERLAADALSHPGDVFTLSGNSVSDYLTDEGEVDAEKVAADVAAVLAERPGLGKRSPGFDPSQGTGGPPKFVRPEPTAADLFKPSR